MPFTAIIWGCSWLALVPAQAVNRDRQQAETIYQQLRRSTAWVLAGDSNQRVENTGTGFFVHRGRKLLVTNHHVVGQRATVSVVFPQYIGSHVTGERKHYIRYDRPIRGHVLATNPKLDLAVVELELVPPEAVPVPLATVSCQPGTPIYLVGNPGTSELLWVYNAGVAEQMRQQQITYRSGQTVDARILPIKTQALVKPGYSGGPVVNEAGEFVGVVTGGRMQEAQEVWCIDVSEVRDVLSLVLDQPRQARRLVYPQSSVDFKDLGLYYLNKDQLDRAITQFTTAIQLDPKNLHATYHRGVAWSRKGDWEKAIADLTTVIQRDPQAAQAYRWRSKAYAQIGATAQAEADAKEALRLDPELKKED